MIMDTIILILVTFLFGYFLGKRLGREEGMEEGQALAPLALRQRSYDLGYCVLCAADNRKTTDIDLNHEA